MQTTELIALIQQLQSTQAESQTIELKTAAVDCPKRLYATLSAFSNQDNVGILIFGVDEHDGFSIKGVYDVQDLQKKVTEQCKQMEPIVRPLFTICQIDGKLLFQPGFLELISHHALYSTKGLAESKVPTFVSASLMSL